MWFKCDPSTMLRRWPERSLQHYGTFCILTHVAWDRRGLPDDINQAARLTGLSVAEIEPAWEFFRETCGQFDSGLLPMEMIAGVMEYQARFERAKEARLAQESTKKEKYQKKEKIKSNIKTDIKPNIRSKVRPDISEEVSDAGASEQPAAAGGRAKDAFYEYFAEKYKSLYKAAYQHKQADFVQLANTRKAQGDSFTLAAWCLAVDHYFTSEIGTRTLADLATRFPVFFASALDKYGQPAANGLDQSEPNSFGIDPASLSTKTRGNLAAAERFIKRGESR